MRGKLTDNTPVVLELQALGMQHNHSEAAQAVIVVEAELEVAKLRGGWRCQEEGTMSHWQVLGEPHCLLPFSQ